jgi:hypothetical protein
MTEPKTIYYYKFSLQNSIFWDIISCSLLKVNRCSGGTFRLHLQGQSISQVRNQHKVGSKPLYAGFLVGLFFGPEDGGNMFLQKVS